MTRPLKTLLAGLGLTLAAALLLAAGAEAAVRFQPARAGAAEPADELVAVRVDERMFTLFAALNAAGLDRENFDAAYHPARQMTRDYLAQRQLPSLARLRAQLHVRQPYADIVWVLHYGAAPDFRRAVNGWHLEAPALMYFGLDGVLRDFYREADLGTLWAQVRPLHEAEADRVREVAGPAVQAAMDYAGLTEAPARRLVVIPNLLDAHWSGYGPQIGETAYIVVGPTRERPDVGLIQHEANHSLVGPLVQANLGAVDPAQAKRLFRALRGGVQGSYGSWESLLEESAVRAIDARLAGPEWRENALRHDEAAGLWLVRPLSERLAEYEARGGRLADFMPAWLAGLNDLDPAGLRPPKPSVP